MLSNRKVVTLTRLEAVKALWDNHELAETDPVTVMRDIRDLHTYMTVDLGNGRSLKRAGAERYELTDSTVTEIPRSWFEGWLAG